MSHWSKKPANKSKQMGLTMMTLFLVCRWFLTTCTTETVILKEVRSDILTTSFSQFSSLWTDKKHLTLLINHFSLPSVCHFFFLYHSVISFRGSSSSFHPSKCKHLEFKVLSLDFYLCLSKISLLPTITQWSWKLSSLRVYCIPKGGKCFTCVFPDLHWNSVNDNSYHCPVNKFRGSAG